MNILFSTEAGVVIVAALILIGIITLFSWDDMKPEEEED